MDGVLRDEGSRESFTLQYRVIFNEREIILNRSQRWGSPASALLLEFLKAIILMKGLYWSSAMSTDLVQYMCFYSSSNSFHLLSQSGLCYVLGGNHSPYFGRIPFILFNN